MTIFIVLMSSILNAQESDDILGYWYLPPDDEIDGTPIAQIFKKDGKYYAYAFAIKDEEGNVLSDIEGLEEQEKQELLKNIVFLAHLKFEDGKWIDGILYSQKNKRYFFVVVTLSPDKNTLYLKVSPKKKSRYSRTLEWVRAGDEYAKYRPNFSLVEKNIPKEPEE